MTSGTNGISKKLCIAMMSVQAIVTLAGTGDDDKFKYAILVAIICVVYKVAQVVSDFLRRKQEK
jgi:hypothetical protein